MTVPGRGGGELDHRAGFTLVELLLIVVVIGILAQIAIPNYQATIRNARAVDMKASMEVVEQAAREYNADTFEWPDEAPAGAVPPELSGYLEPGFDFAREGYTLDWESISIPGGVPGRPNVTRTLGVGVVVDDPELGAALVKVFGEGGWYNVGNTYTYIIDRQ